MPTKTLRLSVTRLLVLSLLFVACERGSAPIDPLDPNAEILTFTLKKPDGTAFLPSELQFSIRPDSILLTLPAGTDITRLTPEITIRGARVSPASGIVQDFSNPVVYTVTAENGNTHRYVVVTSLANSGTIVYIGANDNHFYALDAAKGSLVWKFKGDGVFEYSSPTYSNGTVYIGCIDKHVYAFDPLTGAVRWKKQLPEGIESNAVVADGVLYVGCNDDHLYALNAQNGSIIWKFHSGANISSSPVVAGGRVYFGSSDGKYYALQADTGAELWRFPTGGMINQSGACLVNGILYVGSRDANLYAIEANTGKLKWRYTAPNGVSLEQSSPTVANGLVYMAGWYNIGNFSIKGSVFALNAATGTLVWETLANTGFASSPCVEDGRLFISADDLHFYALDAQTGSTLWRKQILPNGASAAVANGAVYIGGGGTRNIYAFDAATGAERWRFGFSGISTSSPLLLRPGGNATHAGDSGALQ